MNTVFQVLGVVFISVMLIGSIVLLFLTRKHAGYDPTVKVNWHNSSKYFRSRRK